MLPMAGLMEKSAMSRFTCLECHHDYPESEAKTLTYDGGFVDDICPACGSPHVDEYEDTVAKISFDKLRNVMRTWT